MNAKSSQTQTSSQQSTTNPWAPQQPYLTQAFNGASGALSQAQGTAKIPTDFTAQYSPDQVSAFQQMLGYGTGNSNIAGSSANAGGILTGAGANGANAGLSKLTNYTPSGGTQSNIDAANQYVAGQNIPDQVKAAMLNANQEAQDVTNPGIDQASAANGSINSSRNAIAHGIVDRGLAQQAGALSAQLRGQAYNTGLGLAEQNSEAANNNNLAGILGLVSGGSGAVNSGVNANTGSVGQQSGLYNIAQTGISGEQAAKQAPLTNEGQQFTANTNDPFQALQNFYNIIGANNWGSQSQGSGTQTTVSKPSTLAQIGGWTNFVGSLL